MDFRTNGDAIRNLSDEDIAKFLRYLCDIFYDCGNTEDIDAVTCLPRKCQLYKLCNREKEWVRESYDRKFFEKILDKSFLG